MADTTSNGGHPRHEIAFEFIKSEFFRVVHADGMLGGPTPQGHMHIVFYSERPPIPKRMVHRVGPTGELGEVIPDQIVVRDALIREMDVDVIMTLAVAENFHQWLGQRLDEIKKAMSGGQS